MHRTTPHLLAAALLLSALPAQSVVVPNANANARGTTQLNSLLRNSGNPRTYMLGMNAAELANVPLGSVITGVSFRFQVFASNVASWPPADITWSDYQVFVGPAIPTAAWTGNFMANFSSTPVTARSGPMTLPANTYTNTNPAGTLPNAWGEFYFDFQNAYLYTGGDLGLLFSHPGSNDPSTALYLDALNSSAATFGVAYTQSVYPPGIAGTVGTFCIARLHYGYGTACAGTGGQTPLLVLGENVTAPATTHVQIGNGLGGALSAFAFGVVRSSFPLPGGCTLYTVPAVTLSGALNATGRRLQQLNVPAGVLGAVEIQGLVIDAGAPAGFTLTNGVTLTVR